MTASTEAATPASREVQRLSPNDPRRRIKEPRPNGAPFESWVNDSSALRGVQRSRRMIPVRDQSAAPYRRPSESWVNDSRDSAVPTGTRSRRQESACGAGRVSKPTARTGWCLPCSIFPLRWLRPRRRAETLTRLDRHRSSKGPALRRSEQLERGLRSCGIGKASCN